MVRLADRLDMTIAVDFETNKQEDQGPWVAHLRMTVYKVRENHHLAHHPAMMMDQHFQ